MAALNLINGYSGATPSSPLEGWLNLDQGRFLIFGRGYFTGTDSSATILPKMGTKIDAIYFSAGAGVMDLQYEAINSITGEITVIRSDTTNNGEMSFMIATRG